MFTESQHISGENRLVTIYFTLKFIHNFLTYGWQFLYNIIYTVYFSLYIQLPFKVNTQ